MSTAVVRRSARPVNTVSYVAIAIESSGEEDTYSEPIIVSDGSEGEEKVTSKKRKRVSSAKSTKPTRPKKVPSVSTTLFSGPFEEPHATSRHDSQRLIPYLPALLEWFEEKREVRGMPWRKRYNPSLSKEERAQRAYEVLVSEIMLQQTQVATVIPYFNRWLEKFPTLAALASADLPAVHALWKGLGYYRRAGFLLAAAQKVQSTYGGCIPEDVKVMQKEVPGMGRYTAGAVGSIAYGIKAPVLDGNVQRLLSRALAVHANPKSKQTLDILWGAATAIVEAPAPTQPGNINQALIELGSTVCKPTNPSCGDCPISGGCAAHELSNPSSKNSSTSDIEELCTTCDPLPTSTHSVTRFPMKADKKKARVETSVVCPVCWISPKGEEWWIMTKRPATGLLAGLWEFPTLDLTSTPPTQQTSSGSDSETDSAPRALLTSIPSTLLSKLLSSPSSSKVDSPKHIGSVPHIFSHIHKTYEVVCAGIECDGDDAPGLVELSETGIKAGEKGKKGKEKVTTVAKRKRNGDGGEDEYHLPAQVMWVRREEVLDQNVGVGTQKIWELMLNKNIL
ncbi:DNA glycosylase [Ceratobasidium sp. AG-I]|nr:DNA glycosylase [Ceratobasidium sp. AG-I]